MASGRILSWFGVWGKQECMSENGLRLNLDYVIMQLFLSEII